MHKRVFGSPLLAQLGMIAAFVLGCQAEGKRLGGTDSGAATGGAAGSSAGAADAGGSPPKGGPAVPGTGGAAFAGRDAGDEEPNPLQDASAPGGEPDASSPREAGAENEPGARRFTHPGGLSTASDLERMRRKVQAELQPWQGSWERLLGNPHAQLDYLPRAQTFICAGGECDGENYILLARDAAAAYQLALRYQISQDSAFADKAAEVLDAWAASLTEFRGDSNAGLRAALYGYQLALAGELLRTYTGWDRAPLQTLLTEVFYPLQSDFLKRHNGACESNYWANWDLANMAAVLAIGVFADRDDIFDEGIEYFKHGDGQGAIEQAVHFVHPDGSGQWQEAGRDQGHSTLGPMLLGVVCEIAWNQGIDLYGYADNRLLVGSEYVAAYNLDHEVPYVAYSWLSGRAGSCGQGVQATISASGRGSFRAGFDLIYNHYTHRRGIAAPFTADYAARVRPEGGGGDYGSTSGGYDSLGFTTLTHTLEPIEQGAVPSQLRPYAEGPQVTLSFRGSAYATGYRIKRAEQSGGPYQLIATLGNGRTYYVDPGLSPNRRYYYVVSALTPDGESVDSEEALAIPTEQIFGVTIGTTGSHGDIGATRELALDGSLHNFFDGPEGVSFVGLDLGEKRRAVPTGVGYAPRSHFAERMVGGRFQASNSQDFATDVVDLFVVEQGPQEGELTFAPVQGEQSYRYFRYISESKGFGNVAEIQFLGVVSGASAPLSPTEVGAELSAADEALVQWQAVEDAEQYRVLRARASGGQYEVVASGNLSEFKDPGLESGADYYYVVTAFNKWGESPRSRELQVTTEP